MPELLFDAAGRRRSPATVPGFHAGRPPRKRGLRYPADPPSVEEILAVMRTAGESVHGRRLPGLIASSGGSGCVSRKRWRSLSWISTTARGSLLVRRGKGGRRREVGMDEWAWKQLQPWLELRVGLPVGPLFCVVSGPTRGRHWSSAAAGAALRRAAAEAGLRGRFAPHHCATRTGRDGPRRRAADRRPAPAGTQHLGITSIYLQGSTAPRSSTPSTPAARR